MKRIFVINMGSTSSKVAYFEDNECVVSDTIRHPNEVLQSYPTIFDQLPMRESLVRECMSGQGIRLDELDAFVSRGGLTEPLPGGVHEINEAMIEEACSGRYGLHPCSLGIKIAYDLTRDCKAIPLTIDTPSVDELSELAHYSGIKEIVRHPQAQSLNGRAMCRTYAEVRGRDYRNMNFVVANLGGGISVMAFDHGRIVEAPDAVCGEGTFSTNRSGYVSVGPLIRMCYSGQHSLDEMLALVNGKGGLISYLGTGDVREIAQRIAEGDKYADEVLKAMCYQVSKDIGGCAIALRGNVDAVIVTGGIAYCESVCQEIEYWSGHIAPVEIMPGEFEMDALARGVYDALCGKEDIKQFIPKTAAKSSINK